jgi:hypothetical protein
VSEIRDRIDFVVKRENEEKAVEWVELALAAYVDALVHKGRYKEQIEEMVEFLKEHGKKVKWVEVKDE